MEHLKFQGLEIDDPRELLEGLESKGFKRKYSTVSVEDAISSGIVLLEGVFLKECIEMAVFITPKTHKVYTVGISTGNEYTWNSLISKYEKIKQIFVTKYGTPEIEATEPYCESKGYEMYALMNDELKVGAVFRHYGGKIDISVQKFLNEDSIDAGRIVIFYIDNQNNELYNQEDLELSLEEI